MSFDLELMRKSVHQQLINEAIESGAVDDELVARVIQSVVPLADDATASELRKIILADVHGLGHLEPLLADHRVSDVMVVGERGVWIERDGNIENTGLKLSSQDTFNLIERIVAPLGLRVDRASPMVDARLQDGSRVNVIVPPLAIDGPCLTIRRFGARPIPLESFTSQPISSLLKKAVKQKRNVLISGGTGAGKTTLLNALTQSLGSNERIITIEDAAELRIPLRHVVRLESRPANTEGIGRTTLRELLRNALRMRPDRIILGEVRGAEALDMLQAMNTGHEGSFSTCHANSPVDALARVETMVLMAEVSLPLEAIREQLASALDLIVQVKRLPDGSRRIVDLVEVSRSAGTYLFHPLVDELGNVSDFKKPAREVNV